MTETTETPLNAAEQLLVDGVLRLVDAFFEDAGGDEEEQSKRFDWIYEFYGEDMAEMNRDALVARLEEMRESGELREMAREHTEEEEEDTESDEHEWSEDDVAEMEMDMFSDCTLKHRIYDYFPDRLMVKRAAPAYVPEGHVDFATHVSGFYLDRFSPGVDEQGLETVVDALRELEAFLSRYDPETAVYRTPLEQMARRLAGFLDKGEAELLDLLEARPNDEEYGDETEEA